MTETNKFEAMINGKPEERVGDLVGNYRVLRWLGRGGFADVYLGEHIYLKMQSAIKILHVRLSEKTQKDFLNEACIIAKLDHPNIVRILDYGVENGIPFLVMAYAPNGTLREYFPEGKRLSLEQVVPLVQQMASALDYAHEQGLIHRDVKPENMLIGAQDQVLLSDFGLVLLAKGMHTQVVHSMVGTALYMSPEMLEGKVHFASDQYALGIVTYQWLCGECPFTGLPIQVGTQHVLASPPSLCERVPSLSPSVEQVVFRALAKDRTQRYENVTAFANALQDASQDAISIPTTLLSPQLPTSFQDAISIPTTLLSPQLPTSFPKTSPQPAQALPEPAEMLALPEEVRSPRPSPSPGDIWRIALLVVAIIAVIGGSVYSRYNIASSPVSTHSTAPTTIKGISVMHPSPITTVHLTPQVISTPPPQVISVPPPKATPQIIATPTPVVLHTTTVDDSVMGTGPNQFNYIGNWTHCTGGCNGCCYDGTWSWDNTAGDYVTLSFTGVQIKFYIVVGPYGGIGAISVDGGSETMVNCYSSTEAIGDQLAWTSPMLPAGNHTFKMRATGTKGDPSSQDSEAAFDRVDIIS